MDIYKVPPADSVQVAEIEIAIEKAWKRKVPGTNKLLMEVQSLIERIKLDEKKIQQLEKMNGISWLGDEQKGEKDEKDEMNLAVTAADLYKDRSIWDIPINVADGGIREQAFWQGRECGARELEERIFWKRHGN